MEFPAKQRGERDRNHITQGSCRDLGDRLVALARQRATPTTLIKTELQGRNDQLGTELPT